MWIFSFRCLAVLCLLAEVSGQTFQTLPGLSEENIHMKIFSHRNEAGTDSISLELIVYNHDEDFYINMVSEEGVSICEGRFNQYNTDNIKCAYDTSDLKYGENVFHVTITSLATKQLVLRTKTSLFFHRRRLAYATNAAKVGIILLLLRSAGSAKGAVLAMLARNTPSPPPPPLLSPPSPPLIFMMPPVRPVVKSVKNSHNGAYIRTGIFMLAAFVGGQALRGPVGVSSVEVAPQASKAEKVRNILNLALGSVSGTSAALKISLGRLGTGLGTGLGRSAAASSSVGSGLSLWATATLFALGRLGSGAAQGCKSAGFCAGSLGAAAQREVLTGAIATSKAVQYVLWRASFATTKGAAVAGRGGAGAARLLLDLAIIGGRGVELVVKTTTCAGLVSMNTVMQWFTGLPAGCAVLRTGLVTSAASSAVGSRLIIFLSLIKTPLAGAPNAANPKNFWRTMAVFLVNGGMLVYRKCFGNYYVPQNGGAYVRIRL